MRLYPLAAALIVAPSLALAAEEIPPPDLSPPDAWVKKPAGTVRILNKIDSTVQTLTLQTGVTVQYESLLVTLRSCYVRPQDLPADAAAHLEIKDTRPDQPSFSGWMLVREPGLGLYEHPVYDVQLASCQ
jgi:hypothetical protein